VGMRPRARQSLVALVSLLVSGVAARASHAWSPRGHRESRCPSLGGANEAPPCQEGVTANHVVLRLRGGDLASMLEGAKGAYMGVPLVTRTWTSLIVGLALLNQVQLLPPELLALDGALIVNKLQLWRPFTSASFFGGVGAQLLQKLYYLVSFGTALETTVGAGEYLRVIASCVSVSTFLFHLLGWQFLGDGLIMAITVLFAQLAPPGAQMSLYGLKVPYPLLPFAQLAMSYLFTQQVPFQDIAGLFVGYMHYFMNDNLKPDDVVQVPPQKGGRAKSSDARAAGAPLRRKGSRKAVRMNMAASS